MSETLVPMATELDHRQLAEQLLAQAKKQGVELVGPNGLLNELTKDVLETALDAEMTEHLGYEKPWTRRVEVVVIRATAPGPRRVFTGIRSVDIEVTLTGIDEIALSLTAKGLTTGEIAAHFADTYAATVSTILRIIDKVIGEMTEWCTRPLELRDSVDQ
jgi:putative transposase